MFDSKPLLDWTGGPAFAWVVGASLLYWLGGRRRAHPASRRRDRWRTASFVAGMGTIVIALDSPIDELAEELLWVHMVQHILLLVVAPPLLALARPWNRMWHGLPLGFRRRTARTGRPEPASGPASKDRGHPPGPAAVLAGLQRDLLAWHVPAAYDATLHSQFVHALEHATFFGTALLFWTRVIDSPPWRSPLADVPRAVYVGLAMVVSWVLAITFALSTAPIYAPYADQASRPGGLRRSPISSWPPG